MKLFYLLLVTFFLVGCEKSNKAEIEQLNSKLNTLEEKITVLDSTVLLLQSKLQTMDSSPKSSITWTLSQSEEWVDQNKFNNFGFAKVLSAYNTREECHKAAESWTMPNSKVLSLDPRMISDCVVTFIFKCLPSQNK